MIAIHFEGWFQCRLATDPDPADESRGISGMMKVYPGEPDLDRIIRFQPPAHERSHCHQVGVTVRQVVRDGEPVQDHGLLGAKVNLAGNPIFKGNNGIVAEDGEEPVVPFILELTKDDLRIRRTHPDEPVYTAFPFKGLQAKEINGDPDTIRRVTGIPDPEKYFFNRAELLRVDLNGSPGTVESEIIKRRIAFLISGNADAFFDAFMRYQIPLTGSVNISDPMGNLDPAIDPEKDWSVEIKFCGWDPDALCGYVIGSLQVS